VPGAVLVAPEDLEEGRVALPKDRDVVLYCTCPNEATSAGVALQLKRRGITRIRPLEGGLEQWQALGFPVIAVGEPTEQDVRR
jgi:rhodanese-related sulfurtransferase